MASIETLRLCGLGIILVPLVAAILAGALGPKVLRGATHWVSIIGVTLALVFSTLVFTIVRSADPANFPLLVPVYDWMPTGTGSYFRFEFLFDPLTSIMLLTVTGVSLLVVIYSRDYMREHDHPEHGYERFFAYLALFVASMCVLVLGGNFVLLYVGWELVGLCSYLLIGFYYSKPAAAYAAKKAFLVNRVGDFGFGVGILLIYLFFGTVEYAQVFDMVSRGVTGSGAPLAPEVPTTIALLLLCGACGKSAQLPLHVWLPDAMEGPSPVSALIHAATMVTAGIYMIARCGAIFTASPAAMSVVAVIGCATALFAATIALVQTDVKRILAYSTISQLGFMFLGLGVYAADAAVFHLFTHAFFKALLFLGAGSVMHAMAGVIDVRHFSGLKKVLPWTYITFLIGSLALAGFPFLSGFFSKDEILHHALAMRPVLGVLGIITAALTAFYTFRMFFLTFHGPYRVPDGVHAHESGKWMLAPLFILSVGAIGAGYLGIELLHRPFHSFLSPVIDPTFGQAAKQMHHAPHHGGFWSEYGLMFGSAAIAIAGIGLAYVIYVRQPWIPGLVKASTGHAHRVLWNKYYVDELYADGVVDPLKQTGRAAVALDDYLIDGLIWVVTAIPRGLGLMLRGLQTGLLQGYAVTMIAGVAIILLYVTW